MSSRSSKLFIQTSCYREEWQRKLSRAPIHLFGWKKMFFWAERWAELFEDSLWTPSTPSFINLCLYHLNCQKRRLTLCVCDIFIPHAPTKLNPSIPRYRFLPYCRSLCGWVVICTVWESWRGEIDDQKGDKMGLEARIRVISGLT